MSSFKSLPPYAGSTPGADSSDYEIYNSSANNNKKHVRSFSFEYYRLRLRNSHSGTLKFYYSRDNGANWIQFGQRVLTASASTYPNIVHLYIGDLHDFRVVWTNGGSAQTTWTIDQSLTDAALPAPENAIVGIPGGAQDDSLTNASEIYLDLSALVGYSVLLWSDQDDFYFSWASSAAGTLVTSGDVAASTTTLKADRAARSVGKIRVVHARFPFLVVKAVSTTGTINVKAVREPGATF